MSFDRRFLDISLVVNGIANTPAENPTKGTQYIVGTEPTGAFAGVTPNSIARYDGTAWKFTPPKLGGLEVINAETGQIITWDGTAWDTAAEIGGSSDSGGGVKITVVSSMLYRPQAATLKYLLFNSPAIIPVGAKFLLYNGLTVPSGGGLADKDGNGVAYYELRERTSEGSAEDIGSVADLSDITTVQTQDLDADYIYVTDTQKLYYIRYKSTEFDETCPVYGLELVNHNTADAKVYNVDVVCVPSGNNSGEYSVRTDSNGKTYISYRDGNEDITLASGNFTYYYQGYVHTVRNGASAVIEEVYHGDVIIDKNTGFSYVCKNIGYNTSAGDRVALQTPAEIRVVDILPYYVAGEGSAANSPNALTIEEIAEKLNTNDKVFMYEDDGHSGTCFPAIYTYEGDDSFSDPPKYLSAGDFFVGIDDTTNAHKLYLVIRSTRAYKVISYALSDGARIFNNADSKYYVYNASTSTFTAVETGGGAVTPESEVIAPVLNIVATGTALPATATTGDKFLKTDDAKIYTATAANTWDAGVITANGDRYASSSDLKIYESDGTVVSGVEVPSGGIFLNKADSYVYVFDGKINAFTKASADEITVAEHTTEIHTLTASEITDEGFTLSNAVATGYTDKVLMYLSGIALIPGVDYEVTGDIVSWENKSLASFGLAAGDVFIVHYVKA